MMTKTKRNQENLLGLILNYPITLSSPIKTAIDKFVKVSDKINYSAYETKTNIQKKNFVYIRITTINSTNKIPLLEEIYLRFNIKFQNIMQISERTFNNV